MEKVYIAKSRTIPQEKTPVSYTHLDVYKRQGLTNLKTGSKNSRIVNMAQRYGMEHRIVTQAAIDEKNEIDYDAVRKRIDADRKKSLTILEEMLNGAK